MREPSPQPEGLSRRTLIRRGLFGGAILLLGGGGWLALQPGTKAQALPPEGLLAVDAKAYAVLVALAARLIPARPGFPSVDEIRVAFNADRILARVDADARTELIRLLHLFDSGWVSLVFGGRVKPFTQLSEEAQDEVLEEWHQSRFILRRTGIQALRSVLLAAYYGSPVTWGAVGYPGSPAGFHAPEAPVWKGEPNP